MSAENTESPIRSLSKETIKTARESCDAIFETSYRKSLKEKKHSYQTVLDTISDDEDEIVYIPISRKFHRLSGGFMPILSKEDIAKILSDSHQTSSPSFSVESPSSTSESPKKKRGRPRTTTPPDDNRKCLWVNPRRHDRSKQRCKNNAVYGWMICKHHRSYLRKKGIDIEEYRWSELPSKSEPEDDTE